MANQTEQKKALRKMIADRLASNKDDVLSARLLRMSISYNKPCAREVIKLSEALSKIVLGDGMNELDYIYPECSPYDICHSENLLDLWIESA